MNTTSEPVNVPEDTNTFNSVSVYHNVPCPGGRYDANAMTSRNAVMIKVELANGVTLEIWPDGQVHASTVTRDYSETGAPLDVITERVYQTDSAGAVQYIGGREDAYPAF